MSTHKVKFNKTTGRWEVVSEWDGSERRSKTRGTIGGRELAPKAVVESSYAESIETVAGEKTRVLHAPTLKNRMKNNKDPDAGDHFVLSNQVREVSETVVNKPTAESVAAEIENLDPELKAIFEQYGGKM